MEEIDHQKLKIWCYLNYINDLSWFDKSKNVVITNHENIFFTNLNYAEEWKCVYFEIYFKSMAIFPDEWHF